MPRKYRVVSGYSLLDLPPESWTARVPAKWRDRVPHPVGLSNGQRTVLIEDLPAHAVGRTAVGRRLTDGTFSERRPERRTGLGLGAMDGRRAEDPKQRVWEQDQDGVDAEIIFTDPYSPAFLGMVVSQDPVEAAIMYTHPVFAGFWRGVRADDGYKVLIRTYNDFLADEYCAVNQRRLIAMGVIPDTGVEDAIEEMGHCARVGLKGVALHRFPSGRGYPTLQDDRFWQAALDLNMPITSHATGETGILAQDRPLLLCPQRPSDSGRRGTLDLPSRWAGRQPIPPLQMVYTGVFDRFPRLRIYWAEPQAGWPPQALSDIDEHYERNRNWGGAFFRADPLAFPPSFYLTKQCLWGFTNNPHVVRRRYDVGVGQLIWGSGFGPAGSWWHRSQGVIESCFSGVAEDERYRILADNAIEFFHLDDDYTERQVPAHAAA